jgi:hypothetical protein
VRILDLFAGLGGWTRWAREQGHDVVRLDFNPAFDVEVHADILTVSADDLGGRGAFDLILASPPCEAFSVLRIGHNWTKGGSPKTPQAVTAYRIAEKTLDLIRALEPSFWVVENPRAKLRVLPVMAGLERRTVTYCTLGEPFMKPTDLWGGFPPSLRLPEQCRIDRTKLEEDDRGVWWTVDRDGKPCHVSAPRGSRTAIQGTGVVSPGMTQSKRSERVVRGEQPAYLTEHAKASTKIYQANAEKLDRPLSGTMAAYFDRQKAFHGTTKKADLAALRAVIPDRLSELVVRAAGADLARGLRAAPPPAERYDVQPTLFAEVG